MKRFTKILVGVMAFASVTAIAGDRDTETRAYAGLAWEIGHDATIVPDVVVGVRSLSISTSDNVQGADLNAHINLKGGVALENCRLSYVGGQRDIMGNVGVGYSFTKSKLLGTAAVQVAYARAGVDYTLGADLTPYVEVNTLNEPDAKANGSSAPPPPPP